MASSREKPIKATTKAAGPKATPAGPKRRATSTKAAKPEVAAAEARPHLRAVEPVAVAPVEAESRDEVAADGRYRRNDLLEAVCARSAIKRSEARQIVELVLDELGLALERRDELIVPPLGKLSVKRRRPEGGGSDVLTLKLRRAGSNAGKAGESPLADPGEDG
ncbi:HU family DNA-binding protein [Roseicyclus marinus]|uniref:HU family DNA-binding protein n=1 Tax=Roseicyclus marinus TaxID=2161673 RepID=UPI00240F9BFC|nr:HU family DNA-binding protein [Roseicyclus marinus]MDG3042704.1 HU family DNA-binding protein [Roseicyclus marinus]